MPLLPSLLEKSLLEQWLAADPFPSSPAESGRRIATAVSQWFALAMAGPFPCATAMARQSQLSGQATTALMSGLSPAAGSQLAMAVASYYSGQVFGPGTASFPTASAAATAAFAAVFADLESDGEERAERLALGCTVLALSTLVVFPPPMPPMPVF